MIAAFVLQINTSMNILELDSYNLADAVKFNNKLNPKIWDGEKMRPEVHEKLMAIAEDFKEFLGLTDLEVKDITVSGSNANYSYTPYSDIDLHLVVDLPKADSDDVYRELFDAKKYQYNDLHNFKIGGYDVELYVENANKPPISKGVYSVLNNDWINIPRKVRSEVDDDAVRSKYEDLKHRIDNALASKDFKTIETLAKKIKAYRQAGLDAHGELGPENLAFKMLRTQGKIKELYDARNRAKDQELSLKEKAPATRITWGFKTPTVAEDVGMTWDGVSPTTKMFLSEEPPELTDEEILKDFIEFCVKELKISAMPRIKLRRDPQWSVRNKTFGRYMDDQHMLEVAFGQRHIMDVLRTVAHELTHKHQHERENVPSDAGETGSPYENEANARAGILMRDYGRLHPELFDAGQSDLEESASGYIPTKKQAQDPRFSMALTQDIRPGQLGKEANKLNLKTNKQGVPQVAKANGLFEKLALELSQFKEGRIPNRPLSQVPGEVEDDLGNQEATGPEFPPEWPKGTTKIDVSDLTDWYRLGMDISDMDDADPKDYNQGPPQTVVVFPSDEMEQGYLDQFKRLGLKTHDIDPDVEGGEDKTGKHQLNRRLKETELNEVRMAPSNLQQWASSDEAKGIQAGFEAELIFRDTNSGDDDDQDMEPDYDMDERCRTIDGVVDFFEGGDYSINSYQADRLRNSLDEQYMEWQDEEMYKSWRDEREELIKEAWLQEKPMGERIHAALVDGLELDDRQADAVEQLASDREAGKIKGSEMSDEQLEMTSQYSEARSIAEDILEEDVEQTIEKEDGFYDEVLDNFRSDFYVDDDSGFFDDVGLRWMSDVANSFDIEWPYMTGSGSNGGSREWQDIGDSLQDTIDMPVKVSSGYHNATRKPGLWIVEPDSSLQPDDSEDYGLEIVSPPMPLKQALEKLKEVTEWADGDGNAYTNDSTGLHMGVSVPFKGGDVDYLKLILFLGDEYVLKSFGREANTYTKSAMSKFKENIKGGRADPMSVIKLMQHGLLELAQREIQKGVGDGKYTSAHIQDGYIEFRSAGGDWLAEANAMLGEAAGAEATDKLQNTMMRYAYAMYLASRPDLERREYAKKLYKLVAPDGDSQLALFSQFAAGELTAEQLKKQWAEKTIGKEKKMNQRWALYQFDKIADDWTPVPGQSYNGYTEDEVKNRVWAKYGREALDSGEYKLVNLSEDQQWEVYDVNTGKTLEIVAGKNKGEVADKVYDKYAKDGIGFNVRPYEDPATMTPRAKLAKSIASKPAGPEVYTYYKWNVSNPKTGENSNDYMTRERVFQTTKRVEKENPRAGKYTNTIVGGGSAQLTTSKEPRDIDDMTFDFRAKGSNEVIERQTYNPENAENWQARPVVAAIERANELSEKLGKPVVAYEVQPKQEPDLAVDMTPGNWEFFYEPTGRVLDAVSGVSTTQARAVLADVQRRYNDLAAPSIKMRKAGEATPDVAQNFAGQQSAQPEQMVQPRPQDATQQVGTWSIYDVTLGREISRMDNVPWSQADARANELERSTGHNMSVRGLTENFADGKGPGRPGDSQRHGIPKGATIAELEKAAKAPGRKGQLARWQLNMRRGKAKAK